MIFVYRQSILKLYKIIVNCGIEPYNFYSKGEICMTWKDDLAIGVPAIDHQHKMLCDAIDRLLDACKSGKGRDEIISTMTFLEQYTVRHFRDEEVIHRQAAAQAGYPKVNEHKAIHDAFIKKVQDLKAEMMTEGASIVAVGKVNTLIIDWLFQHIRKMDQELESYVNSK